MGHTRNEILAECGKALQKASIFYSEKGMKNVNNIGKTDDTDEFISEVIAEFLCKHISEYTGGIKMITRKSTYDVEGHDGVVNDPNSGRDEEIIAKEMYGNSYDHIGKIIDYQTPLKNKLKDEAGKIDLLAYDGTTLRILELKKPDSNETMLRCVLEGYTYLKTVDTAKLVSDFKLPEGTVVKACPFVFIGSTPHLEMQEDRRYLKRLMELLDSKPYYISESGGKYSVTGE